LIRRRRETPEIVFGTWSFVPVPDSAVLAMRYDWGMRSVVVFHNLGAKPLQTSFKLEAATASDGRDRLVELFGQGEFTCGKDGSGTIELEGYGSRWLRLRQATNNPAL
jgi:maltose alpha-D-glucosyltransferase/alpha-amylase